MNKLLILLTFIIFLGGLISYSQESCITGYACSLDDMKKQENQQVEKSKLDFEKSKEKQKQEKNDGIFVDGGKYNKPEYTEMFMFNNLFP